jgi:hypothetical protein
MNSYLARYTVDIKAASKALVIANGILHIWFKD